MKRLLAIVLAAVFALGSGLLLAAPDKEKDKKRDDKKQSKSEDKDKDKGKKDKVDKKSTKSEKQKKLARAKHKQDRLVGLENAILRLKLVADKLESKGKTDQAKRLRAKIERIEAKLADKKRKVRGEADAAMNLPDDGTEGTK